jgi:hypothetical protein
MDDKQQKVKLAKAEFMAVPSNFYPTYVGAEQYNVDKLSFGTSRSYEKIISDCRYFYLQEPIASTVINKIIDISINDILISQSKSLSKTELQIYLALREDIIKFLRDAALELLVTGFVVPEITLSKIGKNELREKGIQRIDSLLYPTEMYVRDSSTIEIKRPFISSKESYFLLVPDDVTFFIQTKGEYSDGTRDYELYQEIVRLYPEFVRDILKGQRKFLLDNPLIIKLNNQSYTPYPVPYLYAGLESFKHKRNMRRMDYSIAARVISAILHVSVGSDEFPLTEDQEDYLKDLEDKFKWREGLNKDDVERVFSLFTNHTVEMEWIFPQIESLLDNAKYDDVNKDIILSLGFPRVLLTGEAEKSFSSDPEIVTLSPLNTLNSIRRKLLPIVSHIFREMRSKNPDILKNYPEYKFQPINLMSLSLFFTGIKELYSSGNLSRKSYTEAYGFDFQSEITSRSEEKDMLKELGLDEFAPLPHSNVPGAAPKSPGAPLNNKNGEEKGKPKT